MAWENENELQAVNACWTQLFKYLSRYDIRRILQDLWISLGLIFDSQIAGLLEYHAWSYGLMQDSPCCVPLDPLQINLCEFDHTLEISLVSFFGVHPSFFYFEPQSSFILSMPAIAHVLTDPSIFSVASTESPSLCLWTRPVSQSEAPWAHADLCWIFDPVSKTSQAPKHSHAPFCKLIAHCAIQEPEHSAF